MIHHPLTITQFRAIYYFVCVTLQNIMCTIMSLPLVALFMFVGDIALMGYLAYTIYKRIQEIRSRSYFSFNTLCDERNIDKQIYQFTSILNTNAQKTIAALKHTKDMSNNFDFDYINTVVNIYVNNIIVKNIKARILDNTNEMYIRVNTNDYITSVSRLICNTLNRMVRTNTNNQNQNQTIRFTYSMSNNQGSFDVNTVEQHKECDKHSIYEVTNYSNGTQYYLIEHNQSFYEFLIFAINVNVYYDTTIDIIETSIIDGVQQHYTMISFDNREFDSATSTYSGKNVISSLFNEYYECHRGNNKMKIDRMFML